ncbi:MAG TPA: Gfo/Idh/MocA family oxidoreductase [Armatimonadota bacterium]|jgi:hypothetical protein
MDNKWSAKLSRLDFLKAAAATGVSLAMPKVLSARAGAAEARPSGHETMIGVPFEARKRVKAAVIGVGGRGTFLLQTFLSTGGVDVVGVCDIVPDKVARAQKIVTDAGQPEPAGFTNGSHDYENLLRRDDIDLAIIATPWRWHVPMAVFAMEQGHHAATEVPAARTLAECWQMVDTSERTRRHCMMLENCCYGDSEMMVLQMVREGLLGEIVHGEAAYIHNLREELFGDVGEGEWRRAEHIGRNGNLYPTHGLGPVARCMDVNRGDRFDYLVSVSSMERSLSLWRDSHVKPDSPKGLERYDCGDMNTSIIRTVKGRTIMLQHDVVTPRPYSRINMVSGTKGTFYGYPDRIYLDGQDGDDWQNPDPFREKYAHPLWKRIGDLARKNGGHGGMDYIMAYRLIECIREGIVPDMDVYDAAALSAPTPLSEASVKKHGASQKFPDFTRGKWTEPRKEA